jgi:hypothetical protein
MGLFGDVFNAVSSPINYNAQKKQQNIDRAHFGQSMEQQKEFAQNGIQWKVADAKKAGIHPLAALGAQTYNAAPALAGGSQAPQVAAEMGQNIDRALLSMVRKEDRSAASQRAKEINRLEDEIKIIELNNRMKTLQGGGQLPPAVPNMVKDKPSIRTSGKSDSPQTEAGDKRAYVEVPMGDGSIMMTPSEDSKMGYEDMIVPETMVSKRMYFDPLFKNEVSAKPAKSSLPKGYKDWEYSPRSGSWYPVKRKGRSWWHRNISKGPTVTGGIGYGAAHVREFFRTKGYANSRKKVRNKHPSAKSALRKWRDNRK